MLGHHKYKSQNGRQMYMILGYIPVIMSFFVVVSFCKATNLLKFVQNYSTQIYFNV